MQISKWSVSTNHEVHFPQSFEIVQTNLEMIRRMHKSDPLFVSVRIDVTDDVMDGLRHAVHALQVDPLRERHIAILQSQLSTSIIQ